MTELAKTRQQQRAIQHAMQKLVIARRLVAEAEQALRAAIRAAREAA